MTKEEKIKECWGSLWGEVKSHIDENGFVSEGVLMPDNFCRNNDVQYIAPNFEYWRPKSLSGIENNNGWIKIESEDDLPKDYSTEQFYLWLWTNNGFYEMQDYKKWKLHYDHLEITHYQLKPIVKPKPPVY